MKLEQLRPNLLETSESLAFELFSKYYLKRQEDLQKSYQKPEPRKKKAKSKASKKKDAVTLTPEQMEALKKLGLI